MADNAALSRHKRLFWIGCLVLVGFATGIWAAFRPAIGPSIKPATAVLLVLAGLVLLSAFATSRPRNELQRKARLRISVMGAAAIVNGVAQMVPSFNVRMMLMGLNLVLIAAAATGFPKRLFAPRS
jgi:hypothetical protein